MKFTKLYSVLICFALCLPAQSAKASGKIEVGFSWFDSQNLILAGIGLLALAGVYMYGNTKSVPIKTTANLNSFSLPHYLQGKVCYIPTAKQGPLECGSRVVFGAKALSGLSVSAITTNNINTKIKPFAQHMIQRFISDEELIALANKHGVKNLYVLAYYNDGLPMQRTNNSPELSEILARLSDFYKEEQAYFALNKGGNHWILVAAKKEAHQKVRLFYLDSLNGKLYDETVNKTIRGICEALNI